MIIFIWIYGSSAAGKETFINRLVYDAPQNVINHLAWENKKIILIPESLKYIGQFENDPITLKRVAIIDKAKSIENDKDLVVLIKGQDVDLRRNLINKLKEEIPQANHEIIYLHSDLKTLFTRAQQKRWWTQEMEDEGIDEFKNLLVNQLNLLKELKGFKFNAFDSTTTKYRPIEFPPEIM